MTISQLSVANCPLCGKVFQKKLRNQCADCSRDLDFLLNSCLDYLRKNHRSSCEEVSAATGVTKEQLTTWMKEGKLLLSDYPNLHYACASCARPIRKHKLCTDCIARLNKDIRELHAKERPIQVRREKAVSAVGGFQIRERLNGV
ncbi:flagellar protein [Paenibacillus sedimenti]|uniref:Flagellar protein n=1 Tax=Paenibacillus sedimenti TaxID=2770274 RepID=A0A926QJN4_9BACL|nr:flagellar protein [Paenibacillus sedimenti]MBD0380664.1 flagellar protein [Paenibacillus sedimenti]